VNPFVSCICVTRRRPAWLMLAIEYFLGQTFKDSEMVIVSDGEPHVSVDHERIRVVNLANAPGSLGEKRNVACERANGTIIAVWDDDDYHSPMRLHDQLLTLKRSGVSVTAYNRMKFTDGENWYVYDGLLPNVGIGGSLLFTKAFWSHNKFPHQNESEDNAFIHAAWKKREYIATPACAVADNARPGYDSADRMYATIHPANTSRRDLASADCYRLIGQKSAPGRVIDAFRSVGGPIGSRQAPTRQVGPGAKSVRTQNQADK